MDEMLELALKKLDELEKKVERYFKLLEVNNEIDFILKGGYVFKEDVDAIIAGMYDEEISDDDTTEGTTDEDADTGSEGTDTTDSSTTDEQA